MTPLIARGARLVGIRIGSILIGLLLAPVVFALNYQFLDFDPVKFYTDKDWELENSGIDDALNNRADKEKSIWENPDNKITGYAVPVKTAKNKQGETCRVIHLHVAREELKGDGWGIFCRMSEDQEWDFRGLTTPKAASQPKT